MSRYKIFALLLTALCFGELFAQMGIKLELNRYTYMQNEHIFACVTIRNNSGRPLLFGKDPALQGFILFEIRDQNNRPVSQRKDSELSVSGLLLGAGEVRKLVIPVDKYYQLRDTGRYTIHAFISHNMLRYEYKSKDVVFFISDGIEVWRRRVGIPEFDENKRRTEQTRELTYSLRLVSGEGLGSYYLVVEDDKKIYGVCQVGHVVGQEKYQIEVDMLSRLHILMPLSPKVFHYLAFTPSGKNIASSYWKISDTIPMLFRDSKSGRVTRIGGVPARAGRDFRDPISGKLTVSDIISNDTRTPPVPVKNRGKVDLGDSEMPEPGSGVPQED